MSPSKSDRCRGALVGLAVGDALGTTLEFKSPGSFTPITDMVGGGPFHLQPGQWTDDTSMALCLGTSLVECDGFDAQDQMQRYCRWAAEGYLSSTGTCFDIGNTVSRALVNFQQSREPFSGSEEEQSAGNGSLMRLAPIPLFYHDDAQSCLLHAELSSRTTHAERRTVEACRYYAGLIWAAINGISKTTLLQAGYSPQPTTDEQYPWHPDIHAVVQGSYKTKQPPEIRGTGFVVHSLEAALWAFYRSDDFETGALLAANLGDDADTTAAIYGQLAGAYYGYSRIPEHWRARLYDHDGIVLLTDRLIIGME